MKIDIHISEGSIYATRMEQRSRFGGEDRTHVAFNVLDPQCYNSDGTVHREQYEQQVVKHLRWYGDGWPGGGDKIELIEFQPVEPIQVIECDRRPARLKSWHKRNGRQEM